MALKGLGDEPPVMKRRINHLRKAIIESADLEIDGVQISKLAEDELYIIIHLTKGRVAPDLVGEDSAKRPMKLSDQAGKVVVLLFWGSQHADSERTIDFANGLVTKFRGRPFALVGVNHDPVEQLRALQAEGTVDWPNFSDPQNLLSTQYKIGSYPLAYVLDHERKVQYAGPMSTFVELTAGALLEELQNPGAR
jgi:peroxiredoxin